jgi:hypothetical protein
MMIIVNYDEGAALVYITKEQRHAIGFLSGILSGMAYTKKVNDLSDVLFSILDPITSSKSARPTSPQSLQESSPATPEQSGSPSPDEPAPEAV